MFREYFIDQYGYTYRWEHTKTGSKSVVISNFQGDDKGSAKESGDLVVQANLAMRLDVELRRAQAECNAMAHQIDEMRGVLQKCQYDYAHHSFSTATAGAINDALNGN